ncbi:hypothetical protein Zmor_020703 [Zophobas morio]|uniref:Uncharacterized protein n=1 Tax=Zophobas morio TaxID=2755281 RepID=A0AA38MA94_9CUCU|nr:hypothetical protein Zmor_020703 [Zophobas morio]
MRNSSDIFCLKEPKFGENDGSQIFSVNGSSFSRINRRHPTTSDVFQFGCPKVDEPNDATITDTASVCDSSPETLESDDHAELPETRAAGDEKHEAENIEEIGSKSSKSRESIVSVSNMSRNPLTGDGVEDVEHRGVRRQCGRRTGKWMW